MEVLGEGGWGVKSWGILKSPPPNQLLKKKEII